jgi:hypothetical protein
MADLTITASNLVAGIGATTATGVAGEAIAAGDAVYIDASDNDDLKKCQHDGTAAEADAVGIALADYLDTATVSYITLGDLCFGTLLTIGTVYVVSATPGLIAIAADAGSADYLTILGVAKGTAVLSVKIVTSENAIA